jgi:FtsP/CotA-like multicopper oxidase with cupredoxin domain
MLYRRSFVALAAALLAPPSAFSINGQIAGPTLRWKEGEDVTVNVTNRLNEDTSIHWHGVLLPYAMDGVPMVSFVGIKPGATFSYRFKVRQSGTYWYHSHSGGRSRRACTPPSSSSRRKASAKERRGTTS